MPHHGAESECGNGAGGSGEAGRASCWWGICYEVNVGSSYELGVTRGREVALGPMLRGKAAAWTVLAFGNSPRNSRSQKQ